MTTVTSSEYTQGATQQDGKVRTNEVHLLSDGRTITFEYDCAQELDPAVVLQSRAQRINSELATREAAELEAMNGEVPLTKYEFRKRFTAAERYAIDAFNASFESNGALTEEQKAAIRTSQEDYKAAQAVALSDAATIAGVQMYESIGLIAAGRAAEILTNA